LGKLVAFLWRFEDEILVVSGPPPVNPLFDLEVVVLVVVVCIVVVVVCIVAAAVVVPVVVAIAVSLRLPLSMCSIELQIEYSPLAVCDDLYQNVQIHHSLHESCDLFP